MVRGARRSFKQNLEATTLDPADASAHYNLGLLYYQRGEYEQGGPPGARFIVTVRKFVLSP